MGGPSPTALAELRAARGAVSGERIAHEYEALLQDNPRALYREGEPVHLTASAIVTDAPGEHVLLVWHRKGQFWVQPGGHLEPGETSFEAAARREVAEETGAGSLERVGEGPAMLHQHDLSAAFGTCRAHWDVQYLLRTPHPAAQTPLRPSAESPEVIWVPWGTGQGLPEGTVSDLADTLERLRQAAGPSCSQATPSRNPRAR